MSTEGIGNLFERSEGVTQFERLARVAHVAACRAVPTYRTRHSRHDFTQPQLLAIIVLQKSFDLTYRQIYDMLKSMPGVREVLGLPSVPHWTTLQKFATRRCSIELINDILARLARDVVEADGGGKREVAMDSTGIDSSTASRYYRGRTGQNEAKYVKVSLACVVGLLVPCTVMCAWGPTLDHQDAIALASKAVSAVPTSCLLADKGYDLEALHVLMRETHGVDTKVPPVPRQGVVKSKYRSTLVGKIDGYGRRWHVETVMSILKGRTGEATRARGETRPLLDAALKVLATAIIIARP
jgi:hypothetical protein